MGPGEAAAAAGLVVAGEGDGVEELEVAGILPGDAVVVGTVRARCGFADGSALQPARRKAPLRRIKLFRRRRRPFMACPSRHESTRRCRNVTRTNLVCENILDGELPTGPEVENCRSWQGYSASPISRRIGSGQRRHTSVTIVFGSGDAGEAVDERVAELPGSVVVAGSGQPVERLAAGAQCDGTAGAQHPDLVGHEPGEECECVAGVSFLAGGVGEVVP
jgi:hypothetical protein